MERKALPLGWKTSLDTDGEMAVIMCPDPESDGNRMGFGLLIVFVGAMIDIGVGFVRTVQPEVDALEVNVVVIVEFGVDVSEGLGTIGVAVVVMPSLFLLSSPSLSDSQSETFSLHWRLISSQIT